MPKLTAYLQLQDVEHHGRTVLDPLQIELIANRYVITVSRRKSTQREARCAGGAHPEDQKDVGIP